MLREFVPTGKADVTEGEAFDGGVKQGTSAMDGQCPLSFGGACRPLQSPGGELFQFGEFLRG